MSEEWEVIGEDPDAPTKGLRGALELVALGAYGCLSFVIVFGWLFVGYVVIEASRLEGGRIWLAFLVWIAGFVGLLFVAVRIAFRWLDSRSYSGR